MCILVVMLIMLVLEELVLVAPVLPALLILPPVLTALVLTAPVLPDKELQCGMIIQKWWKNKHFE